MGFSLRDYLERQPNDVLWSVLAACETDATEYEEYVADMIRDILAARSAGNG